MTDKKREDVDSVKQVTHTAAEAITAWGTWLREGFRAHDKNPSLSSRQVFALWCYTLGYYDAAVIGKPQTKKDKDKGNLLLCYLDTMFQASGYDVPMPPAPTDIERS